VTNRLLSQLMLRRFQYTQALYINDGVLLCRITAAADARVVIAKQETKKYIYECKTMKDEFMFAYD